MEMRTILKTPDQLFSQSERKTPDSLFSLAALISSHVANTWNRTHSYERTISEAIARDHGQPLNGNYWRLPDDALAGRDLNVATSTAGGYLVPTKVEGYIPTLQAPGSVLGLCTIVDGGAGPGVATPRGVGAVSTTWLASETAQVTESQPVFGQVLGVPKLLGAYVEISRQLLLQSNAEDLLRTELRNAATVALETAVLNGSGASGQPTGIIGTAGIGAFTGTTLNRTALSDAQLDVLSANAVVDPARCAYVATPAIANLLANRADTIASTLPIWQGGLDDGIVVGKRALTATTMPTGDAIYGDWSGLWVVQWAGGMQIQIDPFSKFTAGIVGIRLLLACDVIVARPAAFSLATSVT